MNRIKSIIIFTSLTIISNTTFAKLSLSNFEEKSFKGNTTYKEIELLGKKCLMAHAKNRGSGMFLEKDISLLETPFISWQWVATKFPEIKNRRVKEGDDFVLRIYVVYRPSSIFIWKTKALNYVFSESDKLDETWDNPFTGNAKMIVVNGSESKINTWYSHKRNIKKDFKKYFDIDVDEIHSIAIMTDTDNSGKEASGCYGDVEFLAK